MIIPSQVDPSVNFVDPRLVGYIEARYVRRSADYFICYVSSQTGCNRGCKFCHLTTSGQTLYRDCDVEDYLDQIDTVLAHYRMHGEPCRVAHINFMARGEALANKHLLKDGDAILRALGERFLSEGLTPKFNMSTIIPRTLKQSLVDTFPLITPTIYYSLYSVDPSWRAEWMPGALDVPSAICLLQDYQGVSKKIVKVHGAFIQGENDSPEHVDALIATLRESRLRCEFNIVAYNPFSAHEGRSSPPDRIRAIATQIGEIMPVKVVDQVGPDCGASCGSFYPVHDLTSVAAKERCEIPSH